MRKLLLFLSLWLGLLATGNSWSDRMTSSAEQQSMNEKMANLRAAKVQKKEDRAAGRLAPVSAKSLKATPADYEAPVIKALKGPNGEAVHTGERGAKFYINKNGNKTYLSSNQ